MEGRRDTVSDTDIACVLTRLRILLNDGGNIPNGPVPHGWKLLRRDTVASLARILERVLEQGTLRAVDPPLWAYDPRTGEVRVVEETS